MIRRIRLIGLMFLLAQGAMGAPERHYYLGPWVWDVEAEEPGFRAPSGTTATVPMIQPNDVSNGLGFFVTDKLLDLPGYSYCGDDLNGKTDPAAWAKVFDIEIPDGLLTPLDLAWWTLTEGSDPTGQARSPPLIPTHDGWLRLYVGDAAPARERKFEGLTDPVWPKIQESLKLQYVAIEAYAEEKGSDINQKWLGNCERKYGIDSDEFIPDGYEKVPPLTPTTTQIDAMTDTNGVDLIATHVPTGGGFSWDEPYGTPIGWTINSNATDSNANSLGIVRSDTALATDDHYSEINIVVCSSTRLAAAVVRAASGATVTYYRAGISVSGSTIVLIRVVAGATTTTQTISSVSFSIPDVLKFIADGSGYSTYLNGVQQGTTLTDATGPPVGNFMVGFSTNQTTVSIDDFNGADYVAASGKPKNALYRQQMSAHRLWTPEEVIEFNLDTILCAKK